MPHSAASDLGLHCFLRLVCLNTYGKYSMFSQVVICVSVISVLAPTASGQVLGTFCGRTGNEQPLVSTRNVAAMKFTTDYSVTRSGFSLQYKTGRCG